MRSVKPSFVKNEIVSSVSGQGHELAFIIDAWRELNLQADENEARRMAIESRPDRPRRPAVRLSEFADPDVYATFGQEMYDEHDVWKFFGPFIHNAMYRASGFPGMALETVCGDRDTAIGILQQRRLEFESWYADTGYNKLSEEFDEIVVRMTAFEQAISKYPCTSLGDILLKAEFAESEIPNGGLCEDWLVAALFSTKNFLVSNCQPPCRNTRLAIAG